MSARQATQALAHRIAQRTLPWSVQGDEIFAKSERIAFATGPDSGGTYAAQCERAAYIAHACNNYGKLVEALREHMAIVQDEYGGWTDAELEGAEKPTARYYYAKARALLRELGEE